MRPAVSRTKLQLRADRTAVERLRMLGVELRQLREDAGASKAAVAAVAGIDPSHLRLIEAGKRDPSTVVLTRIAAALGADVSTRLFSNAGPVIRDRFQARMVEAFLRSLPRHWSRSVEVAVQRPVRGVIDLVISDRRACRIVSIEAQSELRRLEQQIRWSQAKTDALPSSAIWPFLEASFVERPQVSRILLLRSTTATREVARTFTSTLAAAFPADPIELRRALADPTVQWPGSGVIWVRVEGREATILGGWPRGVPPW
ncbi:MAG: helix-turn-helix domain-containing protein [Chloroflexota bacterium]